MSEQYSDFIEAKQRELARAMGLIIPDTVDPPEWENLIARAKALFRAYDHYRTVEILILSYNKSDQLESEWSKRNHEKEKGPKTTP